MFLHFAITAAYLIRSPLSYALPPLMFERCFDVYADFHAARYAAAHFALLR